MHSLHINKQNNICNYTINVQEKVQIIHKYSSTYPQNTIIAMTW